MHFVPRATELRVSCGPHIFGTCDQSPAAWEATVLLSLPPSTRRVPQTSITGGGANPTLTLTLILTLRVQSLFEPIYTNSKHPHPHPHSPRLRIQAPAVLKRATGCVPDSPGFALDRLPYGDLEAPKTRRPGSTQARMKRWQEGSLSKAPGRTRRLGVPWHRRLC